MKMRDYFGGGAGVVAAFAAASTLFTSPAHAGDCADITHAVYVTGSTAVKPFLSKVAGKLLSADPPITVVYKSSGSCDGVGNMGAAASDAASKVTGNGAVIFDADGKDVAGGCDITIPTAVDIGVSDVYASSCEKTVNSDVGDFHGPNQVMTFVMPAAATQSSISAEAAYLVYGFGAASNKVAPWNDETAIYMRSASSGTQSMIAKAINVPPTKWLPAAGSQTSSGNELTAVGTTAVTNGKTQNGIGILAADLADANRNKVKVLAYQHKDQSCGWLPDSTATSFDKRNVRDGHYYIWGPLHMYARKGGDGKPSSADAAKVINVLSGAEELDGLDLIAVEAKASVVPDCAMRVSRDSEVGPLSSYQPEASCGCKFEKEATGNTDCTACTKPADCPASAPACNFGYCEVQ